MGASLSDREHFKERLPDTGGIRQSQRSIHSVIAITYKEMAVDAVWREPVSRCISLLTGSLSGKLEVFGPLFPERWRGILHDLRYLACSKATPAPEKNRESSRDIRELNFRVTALEQRKLCLLFRMLIERRRRATSPDSGLGGSMRQGRVGHLAPLSMATEHQQYSPEKALGIIRHYAVVRNDGLGRPIFTPAATDWNRRYGLNGAGISEKTGAHGHELPFTKSYQSRDPKEIVEFSRPCLRPQSAPDQGPIGRGRAGLCATQAKVVCTRQRSPGLQGAVAAAPLASSKRVSASLAVPTAYGRSPGRGLRA